MEQDRTYSIGRVVNMVGVPKYKLRHWCDRYLPHIQRIKIGEFQFQRRFTEQDIELIRRINVRTGTLLRFKVSGVLLLILF